MTSALSIQVGGAHYKQYGIQPVQFCEINELNFCQANIVKYLSRYHSKDGARDVRKAIHYAELWLELRPAGTYEPIGPGIDFRILEDQPHILLTAYCGQDERLAAIAEILAHVCCSPCTRNVEAALAGMRRLLDDIDGGVA